MAKRNGNNKRRHQIAKDADKAMLLIPEVKMVVMQKVAAHYPGGVSLPEVGAVLGNVMTDILADYTSRMPVQPTDDEKLNFIKMTVQLWAVALASKIMPKVSDDEPGI